MVAYFFPPIAGVGAFRTLKFVKYLSQFGWDPVVLTVAARHEDVEPKSDSLLTQVPPSVVVVRTYAWSLRGFVWWRTRSSGPSRLPPVPTDSTKPSIPRRLRWWLRRYFLFPDRCNGWFPFAVIAGYMAVRKYKVDAIYSSAPPYTGTLVALVLSKLTRKPLISDFRDPWAVNTYRDQGDGPSIPRLSRLVQRLERWTFLRSACVINVSADLTAKAQATVPTDLRHRFVTIHNGFDPDDFPPQPHVSDGGFRVLHTGCFYKDSREPRNFLLALRILADRHPLEFAAIQVWFVGDMEWVAENSAWYDGLGLGEHIQFKPFIRYQESLKLLAEADLLLMIGSIRKDDTGTLPVKLFDYAATRRPILALVHEGESARFVRGIGTGLIADPENPEEIAARLLEMYRRIRVGTFPTEPNATFLADYDRRELTRRLAEALDMAVGIKR